MKILFDTKIQEFLNFCDENGIQLYLVGGYLRDYLIGKQSKDLDFALLGNYNDAVRIIKSKYKCSCYKKYQAIKVRLNDYSIEISHCRRESDYSDYRHPSKIKFIDDIEEDSKRRDFTINALYYMNGNIYDFHNGLKDLKERKLRFIGDTKTRISEDPIRILRMIRFSLLGYSISEDDKKILIKNKNLLLNLSKEDINKEYLRIKEICNHESLENYKEIFSVVSK